MKSIASKFNALTVFLILLTAVVTGGYIIWQHQLSSFSHFSQHGQQVAVILSKSIEDGISTENTQAINQALQGITASPNIAYVLVYNKANKLLLEKNNHNIAALPYLSQGNMQAQMVTDNFKDVQENKTYLNIVAPVFSQNQNASTGSAQIANPDLIGYIQLGFSEDSIYHDSQQFLLQIVFVVPSIIVIGILLMLWQTRRIIKPIKQLVLAAQAISQGEFGRQLELTSNDEIAELANAFNGMSRDLAKYQLDTAKQQETLAEQVAQRTQDLQQKTLEAYQLADNAEAASKAKSEFLATMSHEIRTPMNGVLGMTELLINTELDDRQKRLAETAYRSAESLLSIINNILDFSKIEAGKFQLSLNDFDLRSLLEETAGILASQAHHKNLELVLNLPVDLNGIVRGDAERLRQVLINLLGNAIKFTPAGEVQLKVNRLPSPSADKMILYFAISDTGPGIPEQQQDVVFDSFTQVDGSITRKHGGTGLGLAIAKQLVALMGGQLQLSSVEGQGSSFYFTLELGLAVSQALVKAEVSELRGIDVLVIDDSKTNRDILYDQLSYWGVNCSCVENGAQAIEHLHAALQQNKQYQLIILDWHMPEMDGLTLAKSIKNDPRILKAPILMLSSDNIYLDPNTEHEYGISSFLTKPIIQQKLLDSVLEILGQVNAKKAIIAQPKKVISNQAKGTILIAEDQQTNQEVGMYMLRALGYQVEIAHNGLEAVNASAEKNYDLILMDCHMPEMDGFEATKAIRKRELSTGVRMPIIALTADVQKGIVEQCLEAGMDGYLSKPFNKKQLQDEVGKWLAANDAEIYSETIDEHSAVIDTVMGAYLNERRSVVLNPVALENLRQIATTSGETLLHNAIKMFLESAPDTLTSLKEAFANSDSEALRKTAHSFKSACANLGAQGFAENCEVIEAITRQGSIDGVSELLAAMDATLPKVQKALIREFEKTSQVKPAMQNQKFQPELEGKRILLVDDDNNFRLITCAALAASGFYVDEAVSGSQALECIAKQTPDLVLLDAVMEGMDGFETCQQIRAIPDMADVPIIMSTGLGDINSINRAFDVGANDFIIKPLNYPILVHRLWFILRASQNTAELRSSKFQLSAAQRIARLGYWTWDSKQDQFHISEHLAKLCNISLQEFDNSLNGFIALIHSDDRDYVRNVITTALTKGLIQHAEYRLQVSSFGTITVHQEIEAITDNNLQVLTGTVQDITHKKQIELQIHRLAYFDSLTGLASRAYYHERIDDFINNANRRNEQFAFLFLDLDGFKDINDSFGHDVGDHFLKAIAERLRFVVRDIDFAARLGGDEFCIILDNIASEEAVVDVAERCLQKVNLPLLLDQHQVKPRVSIGIAIYPRDGVNEVELMKAADAAMYAAKQAGKQRYVFYSEDMASQAINRLEKEQMLRDAFEQNQFVLHYQPQVSMQTGKIVGMEALIRWQHPEKGMIPPGDFIPLAEQLGLIVELGNWVLNAACQQILRWHEQGLPFLQVAVNIAPAHFQDPGLFSIVKHLLASTGIPAQYLELEVTESAMQTEGYLNVFSQLRALGVKIAIDDFGTGYSCLASLKQLPLDCLKVDKVFVDDVGTNSYTSLLLGTIIGLANALGYTLVAEGVETQEQALVMHGLGCHIIQGYLFSRPVPSDQIPALLEVDFSLKH
jgi:diguanylate cyclase (GGDEF)-like protein